MLPNFLIIGAGKSGTSSLYQYLRRHPQIYMPNNKEPKFFAYEGEKIDFRGPKDNALLVPTIVTEIEAYKKLFRDAQDEIALGEASPIYLRSAKACERIKHYIPEAKLIAVLRNPVDRAYSAFSHLVRDGVEPTDDFELALHEEERRTREGWALHWQYVRAGFYFEYLRRYLDSFDTSQIRIYLYDDLSANPAVMIKDIFRFLEVDDGFQADLSKRFNVSGIAKHKWLHNLIRQPHPVKSAFKASLPPHFRERVRERVVGLDRRYNTTRLPPMSQETRERLKQVFREDILKLETLIERDLSAWL